MIVQAMPFPSDAEAVAPTAPVAGSFLWLKADSLALADGAAVATWPDQSGNGYDAVQATGSKQPTYVASWTNGKPAVNFDGTDDNLVKAFGTTYSQPNTIFCVVEAIANPSDARPWLDGSNSTQRHYMAVDGSVAGDPIVIFAGSGSVGDAAFTDEDDAAYPISPSVYRGRYNTTVSRMYKESHLTGTGSIGTHVMGGVTIGSRNDDTRHYNCRVAEIIAYNSDLSEADAAETLTYLSNKYATRPFMFQFLERTVSTAGAYQGVAASSTHLFAVGGNNGSTSTNTIYKRDLSGTLITSRNTASDGPAAHTEASGVFYNASDDRLYVTVNDFVSGEGWPQTDPHGWVLVYEASDLSFVTYYSLGAWISESVTRWGGYWWEVNASDHKIRQYNDSFTLVGTHTLSGTDVGNPYWQGIMVIDDVFYLNAHFETGPSKMQAYTWNGSGFTYVAKAFAQPNQICSQGVFYDGEHVWWAEREAGTAGNIVKSTRVFIP